MKHFDAILKDIGMIIYPPQVQNSPKERYLTYTHHIPLHTTFFTFLNSKEKRKTPSKNWAGFTLRKPKSGGLGRKQKRSHLESIQRGGKAGPKPLSSDKRGGRVTISHKRPAWAACREFSQPARQKARELPSLKTYQRF